MLRHLLTGVAGASCTEPGKRVSKRKSDGASEGQSEHVPKKHSGVILVIRNNICKLI